MIPTRVPLGRCVTFFPTAEVAFLLERLTRKRSPFHSKEERSREETNTYEIFGLISTYDKGPLLLLYSVAFAMSVSSLSTSS